MTTPRKTFEDYNPYRPTEPTPPPPPIPPKTQKLMEAREWARQPLPVEYQRGFLDPNKTTPQKLQAMMPNTTEFWKNVGDMGLSFLESADFWGMEKVYDPQRIKKDSLLGKTLSTFAPSELQRKARDKNAWQVGATEAQKAFARDSVIGEDLATRAIWRSLPEVLDTESLTIAAGFGIAAAPFTSLGYQALKPMKTITSAPVYNYLSSTAGKVGGTGILGTAVGLTKQGLTKLAKPLSGEIGVIERVPKVIKAIGKAVAEPMVPNQPLKTVGAELYTDAAVEAGILAGSNAQKYHDSSTYGAIGTGALTTVGMAVGALTVLKAPEKLPSIAIKATDKLMNAMKQEAVYAHTGGTRDLRSNLTPTEEAKLIAQFTNDSSTTSLDPKGNLYNIDIAHTETIVNKNIKNMLSDDFVMPKDLVDRRIKDSESTYYPHNQFKKFKNDIIKISPDIRTGGYDQGLFMDIEINRLWESAKVSKTINGQNQTVVDLKQLQRNLSDVERDMTPTIVDFDGVGEDGTVTIGNVLANVDMVKAYYNPDATDYFPTRNREILGMYTNDLKIQKFIDSSLWSTQGKPLFKHMLEHDRQTYYNLPEASKQSIRYEWLKKWKGFDPTYRVEEYDKMVADATANNKRPLSLAEFDPTLTKIVDESMYNPYYYLEPIVAKGYQTKDSYLDTNTGIPRFLLDERKFQDVSLDELLDNQYIKMFALAKMFREHKAYFKFADNTSYIEDLVNKKKIFYSPLESDIAERNAFHGHSKLLDDQYETGANSNVQNGLEFLRSIYNNQLTIKDRGGIRKISPHFEMADTMIWGNKHTQFSAGNNKTLYTAVELNINIPIHGGAGLFQKFDVTQPAGLPFAETGIRSRVARGINPNMKMGIDYNIDIATHIRNPAILGKGLGSGRQNPDAQLFIGAIRAEQLFNIQKQYKGRYTDTVMGGGSDRRTALEELDEYGMPISGEDPPIASSVEEAMLEVQPPEYKWITDELSSSSYILKANPNSNSSKLNRASGRLNMNTGGKDGIPFLNKTNHLESNDDAISWAREQRFTTTFTDPKTGNPETLRVLNEIQKGHDYPSRQFNIDAETGFGQNFDTFEPYSIDQNIKNIKDEQTEFSDMFKPESIKKADADREEFGAALDRPIIIGPPYQTMRGILSLMRPESYSKQIVDNFKSNADAIYRNDQQLANLDNILGKEVGDYDISSYSAFKTISDINKNADSITPSEISFSGGLSEAVDKDSKAFMFANLEYFIKSVVAPMVSQSYKNGTSDFKLLNKEQFPPIIKELLEDMGYEKLHDWENWKAKDWVLKNNKNKTLGKKIIGLFKHITDNPKLIQNEKKEWVINSKDQIKMKHNQTEVSYSLSDEFGGFGFVKNPDNPMQFRFASAHVNPYGTNDQVNNALQPWINLKEFITYFDSEVDDELYDYYTKRFKAQTYLHTSNYVNEPRRLYLTVKHFIEKAIKDGDTYLMFPTAEEILLRNTGGNVESFKKLYDKKLPDTVRLIMREQYGIDLKLQDDLSAIPSSDENPLSFVQGYYEDQFAKEDVLWKTHETNRVMKIPQKIKDDYEKTNQLITGPLYKRVDGEIRGAVDFLNDGRAIIMAFKKANLNAAIHEVGHILRRDLDDEELKIVNDYFEIKDGVWTTEAEEKFANALEDYYINKKVPNPSLLAPFTKLLKQFGYLFRTHVWAKISGSKEKEFTELLEDLIKDIPDNEASRTFLESEEMVALTIKMADSFNTTAEEARGVMATIQGRALAWADETGKDPSDWWKERGFDIVDGNERSLQDFKRLNKDYIDEDVLDGMPNIIGGQKVNSVIDKVIDLIRKAPKEREKIAEIQAQRRRESVARAHNELDRSTDGAGNGGIDNPQITMSRARGMQKGVTTDTTVFEPLAEYADNGSLIPRQVILDEQGNIIPTEQSLIGDEINIMFNDLELQWRAGQLRYYDWLNTYEAVTDILLGKSPNYYQIDLLTKAFGIEGKRMGMLARKKGRTKLSLAGGILDDVFFQSIVAVKSSWDLSAPLRQAFFITIQPQKWNITLPAYGKMVGAMLSGTRARLLYKAMESDPLFEMFEKAGLEIIEPDTASQLDEYKKAYNAKDRELTSWFDTELDTVGEEVFGGGQATFIKMFPVLGQVVKMSERAYSTYLNLIRFETLKSNYEAAKRKGLIHPMDPDLRKPIAYDENGNRIVQADQYYTPEEKGYRELTDFEMVGQADLVNIVTGAGRLNRLYKIDPNTGKVTGINSMLTHALRYIFWSPRLIVSRFKVIMGAPLFELKGVKRLGVSPDKVSGQWFDAYVKRTKSGIPYWAGIEMGGTAFFSTSRLAKKLKLTKYTNGEGWQIGNTTIPDVGLKMMMIPSYVSAALTSVGMLYGLKRHFESEDIDGYVELDPQSIDFGKVSVGPTKYDVLGGNGQSIRFVANMATEKAKSSGTDVDRVVYRGDLIKRFARSKANPTLGTAWDFMEGKGFLGETFEWDKEMWELVLSMNAEDTYEIFNNSLPKQGDELPWAKLATNVAGASLSTSGAGGQTYFTADEVIRTYFPTTDGTRYRYKDMEPYVQSVAKLLIPETKQMFGEQRSRHKDIDEVMAIWFEEAGAEKRSVLTVQELSDARLYLIQRMITQDDNGNWTIQDKDIIQRATDKETGEISTARLGYA